MTDNGRTVFDLKGEERRTMSPSRFLDRFKSAVSKNLDDDKTLLQLKKIRKASSKAGKPSEFFIRYFCPIFSRLKICAGVCRC